MQALHDTYPQACTRLGITPQSKDDVKTVKSLFAHLLNRRDEPFEPTIVEIPNEKWLERTSAFCQWAKTNLIKDSASANYIISRGIDPITIDNYLIGVSSQEFFVDKSLWGLKEDGKKLWMPPGIVIPTLDRDGRIIRVKIRRSNYKTDDKLPRYVAITGSATGVNFIGNKNKRIGIVVESELDAYMLHSQLEGEYFVIGTGSCSKNPDEFCHEVVSFCKKVLIAYDNDEGGDRMWKKWKKIYGMRAIAAPTPYGKDIGEAFANGVNMKEWITQYV
jgi:hypothetical protein